MINHIVLEVIALTNCLTIRIKTDDDGECDYHYCDVMIGSQSMIGNLVSDLHKILHDNIYQ